MPQIRVTERTHQILKIASRQYNISMGAIADLVIQKIENWPEYMGNYYTVCPNCYYLNDMENTFCADCGTNLNMQ